MTTDETYLYHPPLPMRNTNTSKQPEADKMELRGLLPMDLLKLIDAVAAIKFKGESRIGLVEIVMREFCEKELHEAIALLRTQRINPLLSARSGVDAEPHGREEPL